MSMENAVTSERAKPKDHILYNFVCEISKKGIYIETWKQISGGKIWKDEKERLVTVNRHNFFEWWKCFKIDYGVDCTIL